MKKIAIIGCGIMGSGMATNFLSKGFKVYIWNRTKEHVSKLIDAGAIWTDNPKMAVTEADVVFEVTANDESSRSVWYGEEGIIYGGAPGKYLIASATLSAAWVDELADLCKKEKLDFFDIPLTGGREGAESGQLLLLAGGNRGMIEGLKDVFSAISSKVIYFGETGAGIRYKLILNMLQAIQIVALGEALNIAKGQGMDLEAVGEALYEKPGGTATQAAWRGFKSHAEKLTFAIKWIAKDLNYAKKLAKDQDTPLLNDVLNKYEDAVKNGKEDKDWTAINLD